MTTSAVVMAVIGMVVIWGGLVASIIRAVKASKNS
ncbi:methionine/alanine import family NSS transporter small subunit [Gracilibacillus halophilus]|nr:methionine/alanine import family NSS transporter small subunit [Gracilibacillus halophilus]